MRTSITEPSSPFLMKCLTCLLSTRLLDIDKKASSPRQCAEVTFHRSIHQAQPDLTSLRLLRHRLGSRRGRYRVLCRRSTKRGVKIISTCLPGRCPWPTVNIIQPLRCLPFRRRLRIPTGFPLPPGLIRAPAIAGASPPLPFSFLASVFGTVFFSSLGSTLAAWSSPVWERVSVPLAPPSGPEPHRPLETAPSSLLH